MRPGPGWPMTTLLPNSVRSEYAPKERSWRSLGLCLGHDPDLWFPTEGEDCSIAARICSVCPVRRECLSWAIEHKERYGIWGGESYRGRQRIRAEASRRGHSAPIGAFLQSVPRTLDHAEQRA
jgi:WhiB family transcriptional regulator, redox-sensing transcriptional regulator